MSYRIGSFNLCNFSRRSEKDVQTIADIIIKEQFDIIALQEVLDESACNRIHHYLPSYWRSSYARPQNRNEWEFATDEAGNQIKKQVSDTGKGYAFFWNTTRITLCEPPALFTKIQAVGFIRNPYYGRFIPNSGGAFCEFRLINVHLCGPAEDKQKHLQEYKTLIEEVYSRISQMRYGDNRPAYTIILGDYGMPLEWCAELEETLLLQNQVVVSRIEENTVLVDPKRKKEQQDTTKKLVQSAAKVAVAAVALATGNSDGINIIGKEGKNIVSGVADMTKNPNPLKSAFIDSHDHFGYDVLRFFEVVFKMERVNAVQKYYKNDAVNYWKKVSDHVPIKMELIINDDF